MERPKSVCSENNFIGMKMGTPSFNIFIIITCNYVGLIAQKIIIPLVPNKMYDHL